MLDFLPIILHPVSCIQHHAEYADANLYRKLNLHKIISLFNYFSQLYNFDVLHNLAHAILESASGTSAIANKKNNIYGWAAYDSSPMYSAYGFLTKADCIEAWSKWFNETYLMPTGNQFRGNNEYCVNIVYASSSIAGINKSFIVKNLTKRLNELTK